MILDWARRSTPIEWDRFGERWWPYQADETTDTISSFGEAGRKIRLEALTEWNTVLVNSDYDD